MRSAIPESELADFARLVSGDFHADADFASNGGGPSHDSLLFTSAAQGDLETRWLEYRVVNGEIGQTLARSM
jgi:hypothetical protein